jgi:hypothetical protein
VHIFTFPSTVLFRTEFILQESHNELEQVRQLVISVQTPQITAPVFNYTNPYVFGEEQVKHFELLHVLQKGILVHETHQYIELTDFNA